MRKYFSFKYLWQGPNVLVRMQIFKLLRNIRKLLRTIKEVNSKSECQQESDKEMKVAF